MFFIVFFVYLLMYLLVDWGMHLLSMICMMHSPVYSVSSYICAHICVYFTCIYFIYLTTWYIHMLSWIDIYIIVIIIIIIIDIDIYIYPNLYVYANIVKLLNFFWLCKLPSHPTTCNVQVTTASRARPRHVATAERVDAIEIVDVAGSIDNPVHMGFCFWWIWVE